MALLTTRSNKQGILLTHHCLVGRSALCTLRLTSSHVSAHHAQIVWADGGWLIRDLGSEHGTFVNGERISSGRDVPLTRGDTLAFGDRKAKYRLANTTQPVPVARRLDGGGFVEFIDGSMSLPSRSDCRLRVFKDSNESWICERNGKLSSASDGDVVVVAGQVYMLHLPDGPTTKATKTAHPSASNIGLTLRVSRDEEHVELWVENPNGETKVMPPRAHYYTLLLLARSRLGDASQPDLPEQARGWISVPELCRMLSSDESRLNVDIYRIRRDLAKAGVADAAHAIERRRARRLIRLKPARVTVVEM